MVASTMMKDGLSNRTLQYAVVSSMTRKGDTDLVIVHRSLLNNYRSRRRGDIFLFVGTHTGDCRFGDA